MHVALLVGVFEDRLHRVGDVLERVLAQPAAQHAERRAAGRELVVRHCHKDRLGGRAGASSCVFEGWAARTKFAKLRRLAGKYRCTGRHMRVE